MLEPAIILVQFGMIFPKLVNGLAIARILPTFLTAGDDCLQFNVDLSDKWVLERILPELIHNQLLPGLLGRLFAELRRRLFKRWDLMQQI